MRACIALLALLVATPLAAATRTWSGAVDGNWSNPANWGGTAPAAGDDLVFPIGATTKSTMNDFPDGTAFHSITMDIGGYVLGGHRVLLGSGGLNGAVMGDTITFDVTLAADLKLSGMFTGAIDLNGHSLKAGGVYKGPISGNGSLVGEFYLALLGANTYTGPTTIANTDLDLGGPVRSEPPMEPRQTARRLGPVSLSDGLRPPIRRETSGSRSGRTCGSAEMRRSAGRSLSPHPRSSRRAV